MDETLKSPSYRISECCGGQDCDFLDEPEMCWGQVELASIGDDEDGRPYCNHLCQGHLNIYEWHLTSKEREYIKEPEMTVVDPKLIEELIPKVAKTADGVEFKPGMMLYSTEGLAFQAGFHDPDWHEGEAFVYAGPTKIRLSDQYSSRKFWLEASVAFANRRIEGLKGEIADVWARRVQHEAELLKLL